MKKLLTILLAVSVLISFDSCQPKHACGSKHQKKVRNHRIKHNTTFMTY